MNHSLENPFRPTKKQAKKRLFKAEGGQKKIISKDPKEKLEKMKVKYGPHEILYSQVQFLKELEKLIPQWVLKGKEKTAKEIIAEGIYAVVKGEIIALALYGLELPVLPTLPKSLLKLDCSDNQLTELPVLPEHLIALVCPGNNLVKLPSLPKTLQTLSCRDNDLQNLPTLPDSLETLSCYDNPLSKETIAKIKAHKNFWVDKFNF